MLALSCSNCYFNSTMVRLKEKTYKVITEFSIFQFHYGTIKSQLCVAVSIPLPDFNSTMVRLKARQGLV